MDDQPKQKTTVRKKKSDQADETVSPVQKKNNFVFIILGVILLVSFVSVIAGYFFVPSFRALFVEEIDPETLRLRELERQAMAVTYLPLPEISVNLKTINGSPKVLTATFVLALEDEIMRRNVNHVIPEIENQFNTFLREMSVKDLEGIAGIDRITREMLMRINRAITPFRILDVLIHKFYIK